MNWILLYAILFDVLRVKDGESEFVLVNIIFFVLQFVVCCWTIIV